MEIESKLTAFLLGLLCGQFMGFVTTMLVALFARSVARRAVENNKTEQ